MRSRVRMPMPESLVSGVLSFWRDKVTSDGFTLAQKYTNDQLKAIARALYEPVYDRFMSTGEICFSQKQISSAYQLISDVGVSNLRQLRSAYKSSERICIDYLQLFLSQLEDGLVTEENHLGVKSFLVVKLEDRFRNTGYTKLKISNAEFDEALLWAQTNAIRKQQAEDVLKRDAERSKTIQAEGIGVTITVDRGRRSRGTTSFTK